MLTDSIPLSTTQPEGYSNLEGSSEECSSPNLTKSWAWKTPVLGAVALSTLALMGFGIGWSLIGAQNGAETDGLVQSMKAVPVIIPSHAQVKEIDALAEQWFNCEVVGVEGEACVDATEKSIHLSRWAFHDCATNSESAHNGGCHGCQLVFGSIQRECPANNGLQIETHSAVKVWEKYLCLNGDCVISKVDWLHYLAAWGIKHNSHKAEVAGTGYTIDMTTKDKFVWGRTDCYDQGALFDDKCGYAARIPPSKLTWDEMIASMGDNGFTESEVVVINAGGHGHGGMGAHSEHLVGAWSDDDGKLDTMYCKAIQQANWMPLKTPKSLGKTSFGESPQWGGCFESIDTAPGIVIAKGAECVAFLPVGEDGIPLAPGHEPGCFIKGDGTEICNAEGPLKALSTDLDAYYDMDGHCGLLEGGRDPVCNKRSLGSQLIDQYADDWGFFVNSYENAHIKMSKFGNEETVRLAGKDPVKFWTNVVYVPGRVASNPAPMP